MRAHRFGTLLAATAALLSAWAVEAQPLRPGDRVRVTAPPLGLDARSGALVLLDSENLVLDGSQRLTIPIDAVTRIEVSEGRRGNAGKGALIGAGAALAVGLVVFSKAEGGGHCSGSEEGTGFCLAYLGTGVALGAVGGLIVGLAIRTERWRPVSIALH
jgi:hypothetical protein